MLNSEVVITFLQWPGIEKSFGMFPLTFSWRKSLSIKLPNAMSLRISRKHITRPYADQLARGIISEISIDQIKPSFCIWIPHRPVFKTDLLTTTKVRTVFNCSLKVSGKPSLNEAAIPGVDIISKLLDLLNYFWTNRYTLLV